MYQNMKINNTHKVIYSSLITLFSFFYCFSQTATDSIVSSENQSDNTNELLRGYVLNIDTHEALPYTNIYVLNKNTGVISNEKGVFSINISNLESTDSLRFQYIGYKTKNVTIGDLITSSTVYLKEEIFNLSETFIFGNTLNAESIVKKVLENKEYNYSRIFTKNQTFIRQRNTGDISTKIKFKKSTITELDKEMIKMVEEKMPKQTTSYTDFLGDIYFSDEQNDSISLKLNAIRTVSLKEKDFAELEQLESIFENMFEDTEEEEYWKVKSGIFGQKIELDEDDDASKDTISENKNKRLYYFSRGVNYQLRYSNMDDKKAWEFLHNTGRYKYKVVGGTSVNGEEVYIIDFSPKSSGNYIGRMYITMRSFALIRADYEYASGKTGRDIHLLGVGYTENHFTGSIYFEKKDSIYCLKYFSKKTGNHASFDRDVALLKKRKRFLFDKKLKEIKLGVDLIVDMEDSFELLFLNNEEITESHFNEFKQQDHLEILFVEQFDDKLWEGYSIIEPTVQMREYKKQELDFSK